MGDTRQFALGRGEHQPCVRSRAHRRADADTRAQEVAMPERGGSYPEGRSIKAAT